MSADWPLVTLESITSIIGDGLHGTPNYSDDGEYYFINGNNLRNGKIVIDEKTKRASKAEYDKHKKTLNDRTVLVSINGTLGNVACYNGESVFLGKSACYFNVLESVDKDFVKYSVSSPRFMAYLESQATGTTIKNISLKTMRGFEIPLPPLAVQQRISRQLVAIDKKLNVNTQSNQTLEQMAQALFKSWFVDFDPVIDNALAAGNPIPEPLQQRAEARTALFSQDCTPETSQPNAAPPTRLPTETLALFPDSFEEHPELGWIPTGWEAARLDSFLELAYGKALKKSDRLEGEVPVYGSGGVGGYHNESLVSGPGIIVGRKGTVGSLYWEDEDFFPIDTVFYVKPLGDVPLGYCFELLKTLGLEHMNTDAAVPGLNRNNAYRLLAPKPSIAVKKHFADVLEAFKAKQLALHNESASLANLRDTLLPKLLSGELTLAETDKELNS